MILRFGAADRIVPFGIMVVELSITDFEFSPEYNRAIESKQAAEQLALKAKRDLDRIKAGGAAEDRHGAGRGRSAPASAASSFARAGVSARGGGAEEGHREMGRPPSQCDRRSRTGHLRRDDGRGVSINSQTGFFSRPAATVFRGFSYIGRCIQEGAHSRRCREFRRCPLGTITS